MWLRLLNEGQQAFNVVIAVVNLVFSLGDIKDKVKIIGKRAFKDVDAIFDSSATYSQVDEETAKEVGVIMLDQKVSLETGDKREIKVDLGFAVLKIRDCTIPTLFAVMHEAPFPVIVGQNIMQPYGIKLDPQKESYEIKCPIPRA